MLVFVAPMINLCSRDLDRVAVFYSKCGFGEIVRTPETGDPAHIKLALYSNALSPPKRGREGA